jgi:flagellar basal-body rod modification protein FlgD
MSLTISQTPNAAGAGALSNPPASTTTGAAATTSTPTVNEQQFLTLLVAQMQHQDPTQPMQGTDFVTQLAQFSMVEQSVNQTQQLGTLSTQVLGLSNDEASQLVGRTVTIGGGTISFNGTSASPANVTLGGAAGDVTATISDSSGNPIRTLDLGAKGAGPLAIQWDGNNSAGQGVPPGTYTVNVTATSASGAPVSVSQQVSGVVTNVSFGQGTTEVTLASGAQAPISQLIGVGTPTNSL